MLVFNAGLSIFSSGYLYYYITILSIPLVVLCLTYFGFYYKFPKIRKPISIVYLLSIILIEIIWVFIRNTKDGKILEFAIYGFVIGILMGLLLDFLMKWFIKIDEKVKSM